MVKFEKSDEIKKRALSIIPHQTGTFSRRSDSFVEGVFPSYVHSADGSHFTDVDGNEYLDYLCGLGPITLGYNYKPVNDAIIDQLKQGILFSLPHPVEVECSEKILQVIPNADMVKFEKSGSNAVTGAVRASRYITKKNKIAYCGSGGVWHDWQAAMVSRDGGVPEFNKKLIFVFDYNDADGLEQIFEDNKGEMAAIVLEPTIYEKPTNNFLQKVRKIADTNNAILILDEIVTGFRFDLGGCQKYFDLKGDFVCFGKGMGNGLPITAITGKTEFMKAFDELWVSSTNNSETLFLAGTIAVINEMKEKDTIASCWNQGEKLMQGWNKIVSSYNIQAKMEGYPIRMKMKCLDSSGKESMMLKTIIMQEMIKRGIFMSQGVSFISYSHSSTDIEHTINALEETCKVISKVDENEFHKLLEGKIPQSVWSMKIPPTKKNTTNK
jgi:glutamate-1-semialdehyde aminotransferase